MKVLPPCENLKAKQKIGVRLWPVSHYWNYLILYRIEPDHPFLRRVSKLNTLPYDSGPDTRASGWVMSRDVVFNLEQIRVLRILHAAQDWTRFFGET
jgi:hypothetical protein